MQGMNTSTRSDDGAGFGWLWRAERIARDAAWIA
jgi:hypothetical protein